MGRGRSQDRTKRARAQNSVAAGVRKALAPPLATARLGLLALSVGSIATPASAGLFPAEFELSSLAAGDGSAGFVLNGIDGGDTAGFSVSVAGDVNGDGIADVIVGARGADPNGESFAGESYVVFGSDEPFPATLELASLDGSNGFVINGIDAGDSLGVSVSGAGDINGDGIDDLVVGAWGAAFSTELSVGESYVLFGTDQGFPATLELSALDGSNGFLMRGVSSYDYSGNSVSGAGDIDGDGFDDVIIAASSAGGGFGSAPGESYVVYGTDQGFGTELELSTLDGSNGFTLSGVDSGAFLGRSVSDAGDVNGDGIDDLIVGASGGSPGGIVGAGKSFVLFGSDQGFPAAPDLSALDGSSGFVLNGNDMFDSSGYSVSGAGDVNGDGISDLIVGAFSAGESYVVFGTDEGFAAALELSSLDGVNGFVLKGTAADDRFGRALSGAGDVNGDGFDDVIVGAYKADSDGQSEAGQSYVVFGSGGVFPAELELSTLDGNNGFVLNGIDAGDQSGRVVSGAGDVNGDGVDDLIVGAYRADPNDVSSAGESYVIFGRRDGDNDGIVDAADNCTDVANPDQRDTNADGFGNICDADLNSDCQVNFIDLGIMKSVFFSATASADLDGDGSVNFADLAIMKQGFFQPPGPSSVSSACNDG